MTEYVVVRPMGLAETKWLRMALPPSPNFTRKKSGKSGTFGHQVPYWKNTNTKQGHQGLGMGWFCGLIRLLSKIYLWTVNEIPWFLWNGKRGFQTRKLPCVTPWCAGTSRLSESGSFASSESRTLAPYLSESSKLPPLSPPPKAGLLRDTCSCRDPGM